MTRSFKFSFPLPSRKNSDESQRTYIHDICDLPLVKPGTKAEKVLGTSEPNVGESKKKPSRKEKKLQKNPSFMSVTISDVDGGLRRDGDVISSCPPETLHNQPSSPLLGHQYINDFSEWDNRTDYSALRPHRSQSSSTLRSYYDSSKSPLYISQQTSASSARDMALRKGYPRIITPSNEEPSDLTLSLGTEDEYDNAGFSKSKTSQLDLSTLFPKPYNSDRTMFAPHKIVRSPSQISMVSNSSQSAPIRPRWFSWERKRSKESISSDMTGPQCLPSVAKSTQTPIKIMVKSHKRASQTWYEGFEDDQSSSEDLQEGPLSRNYSVEHKSSNNVNRDEPSRNHILTASKSAISDQSQNWIASPHNPKVQLDSTFSHCNRSRSRQSSFSHRPGRTLSNGSQKSVRWEVNDSFISSRYNPQSHSFLILSSSEDELDESIWNDLRHRRHRIRASIEKADTGDEVLLCSAERVKSHKPRPVVNMPKRRTASFKSAEKIPPVPSLPKRPQVSPRVSSMRWREEIQTMPTGAEMKTSPDHSRQSSTASRSASQLRSTGSQKQGRVRVSKMMAVTADEEKLLEAMRKKRASLRRSLFVANGDNLSPSESNLTASARPKTAGEDGQEKSSYFEPRGVMSPPPLGHGHAKFPNGPSYAASADDLSREETFPFESPIFPQKGGVVRFTPKPALPSLSFTPSDLLPSSPISRTSPLTPPPDHGSLDLYETGIAVAHSAPVLYLHKSKHDRKRTISSGIIVLDGAEQNARELDEENEITGWAMDRW